MKGWKTEIKKKLKSTFAKTATLGTGTTLTISEQGALIYTDMEMYQIHLLKVCIDKKKYVKLIGICPFVRNSTSFLLNKKHTVVFVLQTLKNSSSITISYFLMKKKRAKV
jgi:hypothetical protein